MENNNLPTETLECTCDDLALECFGINALCPACRAEFAALDAAAELLRKPVAVQVSGNALVGKVVA